MKHQDYEKNSKKMQEKQAIYENQRKYKEMLDNQCMHKNMRKNCDRQENDAYKEFIRKSAEDYQLELIQKKNLADERKRNNRLVLDQIFGRNMVKKQDLDGKQKEKEFVQRVITELEQEKIDKREKSAKLKQKYEDIR